MLLAEALDTRRSLFDAKAGAVDRDEGGGGVGNRHGRGVAVGGFLAARSTTCSF